MNDNETWLIDIGDAILSARSATPDSAISPLQRLIYCLWVADYGMRNAGDLETSSDLDPHFHSDGQRISADLGLQLCADLFGRDIAGFQREYFGLFDGVCSELRAGIA